ncbi:hypothetical protein AX15_001180 [Amanita polypyramis BW_CC]|nr:hypothetical protein AX15_001180 [Amanita polypyramis BW_CC]
MSSLPISIRVGSVSSARSTIESALNSYRRVQYLIAESPIGSSDNILDAENDVEEGEFRHPYDDAIEGAPSRANDDSFVSQLLWDEETNNVTSSREQVDPREKTQILQHHKDSISSERSEQHREDTPLLQTPSGSTSNPAVCIPPSQEISTTGHARHAIAPRRRPSAISSHSAQNFCDGQSTFGQSLFNTITILLGIGVLSEPLAFAYTGWIAGTALLIGYAFFSGHAVIPSIARDMRDPSQFDTMVNWAFAVATLFYAATGYAGYLMFGDGVSDEISKNLLLTIGYNPTLNKAVLWVMVINPLTKFALTMNPLFATLDIILSYRGSSHGRMKMKGSGDNQTCLGKGVRRVLLTVAVVVAAIIFPQFSVVNAFVGSFSCFMVNVIGPLAAKISVHGRCSVLDGTITAAALVMAIWGTFAVFMSD